MKHRKKTVQVMLLGVCLLLLMTAPALAYTEADAQAQLKAAGADTLPQALPGDAREMLQGIDVSSAADLDAAVLQLLNNLSSKSSSIFSSALRSLTKILLVAVLIGCLSGLQNASGGAMRVAQMAGALGMTGVLFSDLTGMMELCVHTLEDISVFARTLLPVMAAGISMSGAPTTATMMQGVTLFGLGLLIRFITGVLVPAVSAYIAIITVNAALGDDVLGGLAAFVKWATTGSLKLIMTFFIAYLSLSGTTGGSVDALAVKTAKFAVSGSVPVVGGIISDAAESMLAGAVVIKNAIGVFGMLCVAGICIIPFLKVGINYLLFKAGAALLSPVCGSALSKLLSGLSDSFGLLLGMLGTCCAVLFFELLLSIAMVRPI